VPGYNNNTVNKLRLWSAQASEQFNFQVFNAGDYTRAVIDKNFSENISKVLYPNDNTLQGQELRLSRSTSVACSCMTLSAFTCATTIILIASQKVAIQLNDTHPSIGVAELILVEMSTNSIGTGPGASPRAHSLHQPPCWQRLLSVGQ